MISDAVLIALILVVGTPLAAALSSAAKWILIMAAARVLFGLQAPEEVDLDA